VTRSHGLRIHDLAKLVIESSTNPDVGLPVELVPVEHVQGTPPEPRQSPDGQGRPAEAGERRERRTRRERPDPVATNGRAAVTASAPAPRAPHGRHARAER
jgi:hypothetical protein